MRKVRCAIYTRKSSEEGLEQDFNSLDAQREACAAYVLSQASEGWTQITSRYDDGGVSGGTLERPALQRLLTDVSAGLIDIIVVYKVDRLTRSLLDFSRLVESFDAAGVSFVSVTQSFNTTTSMGRLTLNMLLSFAQFEREVTAERIRDKIAASKAKGMWMGGTPPLGYGPKGRTLEIVEEHAALIRDIYSRYLAVGNVRLVADQLQLEGIRSPGRTTGTGRSLGGGWFTRGQLYAMLKNPIYVGDIAHRGQNYQGQHPAIIDRDRWQAVQAGLADHIKGERRARRASASLLAGLIVDEAGEPLVAAHACKGKVRYRYYVSRALQHGRDQKDMAGLRLPAREIESVIVEQVATLFDDPLTLAARLGVSITPALLRDVRERCASMAAELRDRGTSNLHGLVAQVRVLPHQIDIDVLQDAIASLLDLTSTSAGGLIHTLRSEMRLTRTGRAVRLVQDNGAAAVTSGADVSVARLLAKARRWWSILAEGQISVAELAAQEGLSRSYVSRVVRLAFLSPEVVEALLNGHQRAGVDAAALKETDAVAAAWTEQKRAFLPARMSA
jgi:DNA invertase Pin-like site-specific DNA recombinase